MAEGFTRADDIQLAAETSESAGCTENGEDTEACAGAGGVSDAAQAPQTVTVVQPPDGGEIVLQAVEGEIYDLQFDPRLAEVRVLDADGDQDLDVVLVFNGGTAEESRIVFRDMVEAAQSGTPPMLQLGGSQFGADLMVQQARALAGEQPTLETATPPASEAEGTGVTQYDDNLGSSIDLLDPQGVIPPVEMVFPSPDPIETAEDVPLESPPLPPTAFGSSVTSVEGELIGIPGSPVTVGGFFYEFDVGEENDISDNIHGTDPEDGVTTDFTITSLPDNGVLVIDRGDDGTLDEVYGVSNAFIAGAQPLPPGGLEITSDDAVFYFLPIEEVVDLGVFPEPATFTYFTTDSDGLTSNEATIEVGFPDAPSVAFDITVSSEDDGNDAPTQAATIAEEDDGDDLGTYAIALSGDPLTGPNTASVTVSVGGDTEDADFTQAVVDAIAAGANVAGVAFLDNLDGTVTLTWDADSNATVLVDLEAFDDDLTDSPETLSLSLSDATIGFGSVSIDGAKQTADLTIEDIDAAVTFDISVTPGSISEDLEESATFTVTMTGDLPAGNTATVDIALIADGDGDAQAADGVDYLDALAAAITAGVSGTDIAFDGTTLTFTGGGDTTFDFTVTADDDSDVEGVEDINVQLTNDTVAFGTSSIGQDQAEVEITELDAAVTFDISVTPGSISEDLEEAATFTVTMSGALPVGNSATVDIALIADGDGDAQATDGVDYLDALVAAITAGVSGTDIAFDGTTLTFTGGGDTTFDFTVTADDDSDVEGVEDINVQLTNDTVAFGTSSIGTDQAEVEITELDAAVTFDISVTPGSISEDAEESATFTVTMSGGLPVGNTATVDIALFDDGDGDAQAADGVDYQDALVAAITAGVAGTDIAFDGTTLTFTGGGDTTFDFTLTAQDDDAIEGVEDVNVQLTNDTVVFGTSSIGQNLAEVDITELDAAVTFDITATPGSISEDAEESATFTVTMSGALAVGNTATVDIALIDDGDGDVQAADGVDYLDALVAAITAGVAGTDIAFDGTTLTFTGGGDTTFDFTLTAQDDELVEGVEDINVQLTNDTVTFGSSSIGNDLAEVEITELDAAVTFDISVTPGSISEDLEEGATFTVSMSGDLPVGNTATVDIGLFDDGDGELQGTDGVDYLDALVDAISAGVSGTDIAFDGTTLTFTGGGDTTFDFTLTAQDDDAVEGVEDINVRLTNDTVTFGSSSIGNDLAEVEITELDAAVTFDISVTPGSISEDLEEGATFTVSMSGDLPVGNTATVDIGLFDDGDGELQGTDGVDYLDALVDAISAGVSGTDIAFDGTTLTFTGGGDTTFDFTLTAQDDDAVEGVEDINVQLTNDTVTFGSSSIGNDLAEVEITELDAAVTFDISATPGSISEDAEESATFTVTMSGALPVGNTATVDIALIADGDGDAQATDGVDYLDALIDAITAGVAGTDISFDGTTLTFTGGGDTTFDFTLTAQDDDAVEGVEDINVQLSNDSVTFGTSSIGQDQAEVEITERDAAVVFDVMVMSEDGANDASTQDATIFEEDLLDDEGTFRFTLTGADDLTDGNTATVTLTVSGTTTNDGADNDFQQNVINQILTAATAAGVLAIDNLDGTLALTWDENAASFFDVDLTAVDDEESEGLESLTFTLSDATILDGVAMIDPAKTAASLNIDEDEIQVFGAQIITNSSSSTPNEQVLLLNFSDMDGILDREISGIASFKLDLSEEGQQGFFPFDEGQGNTNPVALDTDTEIAVTLKYIQGSGQFNLTDFGLLDELQNTTLTLQDQGNVQFSGGQGSGAQAAIWLLTPDTNGNGQNGFDISESIEVFIEDTGGVAGLNEIALDTSKSNTSFDLDLGLLSLVDDPSTPFDGVTNFFDEDLFGETESIDISGSNAEDNSLTLAAQDVLDLTEGFADTVTITGDTGDTVNLVDQDGAGGDSWTSGASAGGFTTYTYGATGIDVVIDDDLTVNQNIIV